MKLDIELLKQILIWCEEKIPDENIFYSVSDIQIPNFAQFQIYVHSKKLIEAGYINATEANTLTTRDYDLDDLTLEGYELLNLLRSDTVGSKIKKQISELGLKAFPILLQTAIKMIENSIK